MSDRLLDYMRQYPKLLPDEVIDELMTRHEIESINESYRNCTYTQLSAKPTELFSSVLKTALPDYYTLSRTLNHCTLIEEPRVLHYAKSDDQPQFFDEHADAWDVPSSTRQVSVLAYLNDVEEGGLTVFPHLDLSITPERGTVVLFPAHWPYYHFATPPLSGDKHVLVTWLHFGNNGVPAFKHYVL